MISPSSPERPPERPRAPPPELLIKPLTRMLRPLVRLLIQSGITFPVLADVLRGLFIDVARRDFLTGVGARTDSRISLLTGVHRKEIRRQRGLEGGPGGVSGDLEPGPPEVPVVVTVASEIMGRWLGSPDYRDAAGRVLALPRNGAAPSFEALVASITRDLRARAVLDDWLDQGTVTVGGDGLVRLATEGFIPREAGEGKVFYFARNLHDHLAAAAANLVAGGAAPFLERSVHYDRLGAGAAEQLAGVARGVAQAMLLEVNQAARGIADADDAAAAAGGRATRRVNLGVYLFVEDDPVDQAG